MEQLRRAAVEAVLAVTRGRRRGRGRARWRRAAAWGAAGLVVVGVGPGCSASREVPAQRLADRESGLARRLQAVNDWRADPGRPGGALALARILWSDREPGALRIAALGALADHAPQTLWRSAERGLTGVGDPAVVAAVARRAAENDVASMVGPLVRRWARPVGDAAFRIDPGAASVPGPRPEAAAVVRLTGRTADDALREVLQNDPSDANAAAAWALLGDPARFFDSGDWASRAAADPPASHAARTLVRWMPLLDGRPVNVEQVRGLTAWSGAPLPPTRPPGMALRHLPLAAAATADRRSVSDLLERLAGSTHVPRRIDGASEAPSRFSPDGLSPADTLALHTTLDALATPGVVAALFAQADADHADPASEHGGGLLRAAGGGGAWRAEPFASARRAGDHAYATPADLLAALYRRGLAHYHFHAQRHHHGAYAGPGPGDLDFAAHSGLLCLTLTFIDSDHLNVDAALPDRSVIDLGCIRRPGAAAGS